MRIDYSSAVTLALERAQALAVCQGVSELEPRHLLQGLLQEDEGRVCVLLAAAGVKLQRARTFLADQADQIEADFEPLPLSESTRAVLRHAAELSRLLSADRSIATEQVLFAILDGDEATRRWLEELGLDFKRVQADLFADQGPPLRLDEPLDLDEPRDQTAIARILDASANRAREAMRVLEDYVRFALDDSLLTAELKSIRHELGAALASLPGHLLLSARNTPGDVGTEVTTPQEHHRAHPEDVLRANAKRVQEALRSLEEYGKLFSPDFAQTVEALRYRAYTLEGVLLLGGNVRERLVDARLYVLVTESQCRLSLAGTIAEAAAGGAQIVQLREKGLDDRTLLAKAREARRVTHKAGALLIINDRPDIALVAQADGVHLGQEDMPVADARRILGPDALIGVSTHNIEQLQRAVLDGASYVGVGPTFPSGTKSFPGLAGLDYVRAVAAQTSLPAFVIGGVTLQNLPEILAAGGRRVAVGQAIVQADDPRTTASQFRRLLAR